MAAVTLDDLKACREASAKPSGAPTTEPSGDDQPAGELDPADPVGDALRDLVPEAA